VFADLHSRGIDAISVVDGGDRNKEGFTHYAPRLRFYQLMWQMRSFTVHEIAPDVATLTKQSGEVVATCDERYVPELRNSVDRKRPLVSCCESAAETNLINSA
jgi:hypothetical protein